MPTPAQTPTNDINALRYHAYTVREGKEGQKAFWVRIGAVFGHDDNAGATLVLDALPLDGRVVLRTPKSGESE